MPRTPTVSPFDRAWLPRRAHSACFWPPLRLPPGGTGWGGLTRPQEGRSMCARWQGERARAQGYPDNSPNPYSR